MALPSDPFILLICHASTSFIHFSESLSNDYLTHYIKFHKFCEVYHNVCFLLSKNTGW